jgi:hypothetical protein
VVEVALSYLVWAPLGTGPCERFLAAHARHPPGVDHRLVVILNGFDDATTLAEHRALFAAVEHDELLLRRPLHDLGAYRLAAAQTPGDTLAFVNSYAEPLADGWLARLLDALAEAGVGMVGATGSFESAFSAAPRPLKPLRALAFPSAPNPHLRTNAFALRREVLERLAWRSPRTKGAALRLESGRRGLSRQVVGMGLELRVVGRDGSYDVPAWPDSATFRSGDQEQLLVADNRTHQYAQADYAERARLAAMAWR